MAEQEENAFDVLKRLKDKKVERLKGNSTR